MDEHVAFGPLTTDGHAAQYARVLANCFARQESESAGWIARHNRADIRVMGPRAGGAGGPAGVERVEAGLILLPMGQFFGGRSVPMMGVAAVGVAPEARGHGLALRLMREALLEMHANGWPISTLYAATQALYRKAGYEQAGHRFEVRVPLARIDSRERGMSVRPIAEADKGAVRALYRAYASGFDGHLDRSETIWNRVEFPPPTRTEPARGFLVERESGGVEGYIYLTQVLPPVVTMGGRHEVHVHDFVATTARAARRLWAFLAGYATMGTEMVWFCGPSHPLLALLAEQAYRMTLRDHWMVRIVDVPRALAARGYGGGGAGVSAELHLEVRDELIAPNNGRFILRVRDGRGTAEPGGEGRLKLDINGLASLFCGYLPIAGLRVMGLVEGADDELALAAAVFAGNGAPGMSDMF